MARNSNFDGSVLNQEQGVNENWRGENWVGGMRGFGETEVKEFTYYSAA